MDSPTTFPISFDRPSRKPMTALGAGPKALARDGEFFNGRHSAWGGHFKPRSHARPLHLPGH